MPDRVLPFYVVCDESYSMTDHMDALNASLRELHRCVAAVPATTRRIYFCLIGFAEDARVVVPLSPLGHVAGIAGLTAHAATNFGRVFTKLRDIIEQDVSALLARSCEVHQPTVFFLSDGQPTDPQLWRAAFDRLVEPGWPGRPKIIAFGIGDADAATIGSIGEVKAYLSNTATTTPAAALRQFAIALNDTIVLAHRGECPRLPDAIPGFTVAATDLA